MEPNPQPLDFTLPLSYVTTARRIYCVKYERCLAMASKTNWASFHCGDCKVTEELSRDEIRDQAESIRAAIANAGRDLPQDR